jgi:peptidoglycan/LPS O-acetylase OafA/YrhL
LIFNTRVYATAGVQVFFVLSGFVIAYILRNEKITPVSFGRFLLRRATRLDPPYWVAILLSSSVIVFLAGPGHRLAAVPSPRLILAHLFYLQDILGYGEPIDHIYWTLCIEIQMYLVFCALLGLLQAFRLPFRAVLGVGLIFSLAWPVGFFQSPVQRFFLDHEYCFLAGAVAWWTVERSIPRWITMAVTGAFLAASFSRVGDYKIWVTFTTALLLVTSGRLGTLSTWLSSRPLQFLGSISYGLYLVHDPIIALTLHAQHRLAFNSTTDAVFLLFFIYLASFTVAYALRRFVEIPSIRLSHEFKSRHHAQPATNILPIPKSALDAQVH